MVRSTQKFITNHFCCPAFGFALIAFLAGIGTTPALAQPTLTVSTPELNFLQDAGTQSPPSQTFSITSAPANALVSLSGTASWLYYSQSSATAPSIVTVNVIPTGLSVGVYTASITVSSAGAVNRSVLIRLTVTSVPPSNANPTQLAFTYVTGSGLPDSQQFYVNANSQAFSVNVNQPWLFASVNTATNPAIVTVSVNPYGLQAGTHSGLVTITFATNPVSYQLVNVTLTVDEGAQLWTTSGPVKFNYKYGDAAPASQFLSISYASVIVFIAEVNSTGGWLKIANNTNTGFTPANIELAADPTGLVAGTYSGSVVINSPGVLGSVTVPVTLIVTGAPALSVSPSTLTFEATAGGAEQSKAANISSAAPTGYTATVALGAEWLGISPASGNAPQALTVKVSPANLGPGTYRGSIIFAAPGAGSGGQLLGVTLTVTGTVSLTASPQSLSFTAAAPGTPPAAQAITVTSNFPATVAAASSPGWLSVTPLSGSTPASFSVSVVTAGLAAGVYNGTVTISSPGAGQTVQIPVSLTVGGARPTIREFTNGGSGADFAPGSLMIVLGTNLGPSNLTVASLNGSTQLPTSLSGAQVFINNIAAPLLLASSTQVYAMVPFEAAGQGRLDVAAAYQGVRSDTRTLSLLDNAPILFTADGSGRGRASAINQNGAINIPGAGAPRGSVIQLYGAGGGLYERDLLTGSIIAATGRFRSTASVFIGGVQAEVVYAGPAPGQVAGLYQVNAIVPQDTLPGANVPVTVRVGAGFSQPGVTIAVE